MLNTHLSQWFQVQKPNPNAKIRLFCFPYAGGGTAIFRDWCAALPNSIEVIAIRLPGRENRFSEEAIGSLSTVIELLFDEIKSMLDKPYLFFGHSNGALVCYELARYIQAQKSPLPQEIILSAKCPPHIPSNLNRIAHLPTQEFIEELRDMNGTPVDVLDNNELMQLLTPMLRADFSLSETFEFSGGKLLGVPSTLFYGLQDKTTPDQVLAWRDLLEFAPVSVEFSGGHFFIDEQRPKILSELASIVERCLSDLEPYSNRCMSN